MTNVSKHHKYLADITANSYLKATISVNDLETWIYDGTINDHEYKVVTVRGTEASRMFSRGGWRDIIRDLKFLPVHDKETDCYWHGGILQAANMLLYGQGDLDIIGGCLLEKLVVGERIILAGHSLGAGISLIIAMKLRNLGYDIREWVGFGTPNIWYSKNKEPPYITFKTTAYKYRFDLVTTLPPRVFGFGLPFNVIQLTGPSTRWSTFGNHDIAHYQKGLEHLLTS